MKDESKRSKFKRFFGSRSRSRTPDGTRTPDQETKSSSVGNTTILGTEIPRIPSPSVVAPEVATKPSPINEPALSKDPEKASNQNADSPAKPELTAKPTSTTDAPSLDAQPPSRVSTQSNDVPKATVPPTVRSGETDLWSAAFMDACSDLTPERKSELKDGRGLQDIFSKLSVTDEKDLQDSPFRKGVRKLGHVLQSLYFWAGLAAPFASMDPMASTAFGLAQAVMTIGIGLCGAEEELTGQIQALLERMPIIDRCDEILRNGSPLASIYEILVLIYKDLLKFFFEALKILRSSGFFFGLLKSQIKQPLSEIVASFTKHEKTLLDLINTETLALVKDIKEDQINDTIWKLLDNNRNKESEYHNALRKRADEACAWIATDPKFHDMGCGKSTLAAYVVDYLNGSPEFSGFPRPVVCSYYCRDDNETNKVRNIYCSLLSQILVRKKQLKQQFVDWYNNTKAKIQVDPTQSEDELRSFLADTIASSTRRVFLVLDGMDECDDDARKHLLALFLTLSERKATSSVFLSSRHDDSIKRRMPLGTSEIELLPSKDRDRLIVSHLVNLYLDGHPDDVRQLVIEDLSAKADGCAIWVRMVLEYLQRSKVTSRGRIKKELEGIPSPEGLNALYGKLFKKAADDIAENEQVIEAALEILATASRPLSLQELAYAISVEEPDESFATIAELEDFVDSVRVMTLIHSFTTAAITEAQENPELRLVHQSLKELIVRAPPATWSAVSKRTPPKEIDQRNQELNGKLMSRCVKYLLLEECDQVELFPRARIEMAEMEDQIDAFYAMGLDEDEPGEEEVNENTTQSASREFDPHKEGLGAFFTYAACNWIWHACQTSEDLVPQASTLNALSRAGSLRLRNWLEHLRRPYCSMTPIDSLWDIDVDEFDPLVVAARFGNTSMLSHLLDGDLDTSALVPDSAWTAATMALSVSNTKHTIMIHNDKGLGHSLRWVKFSYTAMTYWGQAKSFKAPIPADWDALFRCLIDSTLTELTEWGNEVLCTAACHGCLPIVKLLFESGSKNPELKKNLLHPFDRDSDRQSIAEAAFWGNLDVVAYLCEQDGIEDHVRYRGPKTGRNTASWACGRSDRGESAAELVVKLCPEGADIEDNYGWTPLFWALNPPGHPNNVKVLIQSGVVDLNKQDQEGRSAVSFAASYGHIENMQILLDAQGVDVNSKDSDGRTPLSYAAYKGNATIVRLLLDTQKIHINEKDNKGRTPLSWAAQARQLETVRLLLDMSGIDQAMKDNDGKSAEQYARDRGMDEVADLLASSRPSTVAN